MGDLETLPITTGQGDPMVHKFYTHGDTAKGLMITFPGDHYGVDGPALYFPNKLMDRAGWDTLMLTYGYQSRSENFALDKIPEIMGECSAVVRMLLEARTYPKIVLLGKSLGCGVVAFLCQSEPKLAEASSVYLTPPVGTAGFDPLFSETNQPSLLVIGSEDRFYEEGALEKLQHQRDFEWLLLHGLTHSLDKPGDIRASLRAIEMITERIVKFVTGAS